MKISFATLALNWFLLAAAFAQENPMLPGPILLSARMDVPDPTLQKRAIEIYAGDPTKFDRQERPEKVRAFVFNQKHPAAKGKLFWQVMKRDKDGAYAKVAYETISKPSSIELVLEDSTEDAEYLISPAKGEASLKGLLRPGWSNIGDWPIMAKTAIPDVDLKYLRGGKALQPSISTGTSTSGGNAGLNVNLYYGTQDWDFSNNTINYSKFEAMLEARVAFDYKNADSFFGSIEGEIDWTPFLFAHAGESENSASILAQLGIHARVEADQDFDDIDGAAGISFWVAMNGPIIETIGDVFHIWGDDAEYSQGLRMGSGINNSG